MSAPRPLLHFEHGWAHDAGVWAPLRAALADWPQQAADAGYFDAPVAPGHAAAPVVAIGHSLGFLKLLQAPPPGCIAYIAINGFARFAGGADYPPGVAPRLLERMMARLERDPAAVVDDFRRRAGSAPHAGTLRPEPLRHDLRRLLEADERQTLAASRLPLLALAGTADPIVAPALTQAQFGACAGLRWRDGGGHLLPVSDPGWCAGRIRAFLAGLPS
ncbi:alpha/beta fold hydrolase [Bordetella genomosp. 6]|uniref:alpha/beta fold hydrolase n=1 Tax=Bordetella genomosp. 6 TaxID=463024 RepID=UPI000A29522F|nr:alpha/beta hydrolase [Bordetella genomosp. 6]ARP76043.1 alpha/beta hydrolase [Bordetella genomosp. 6]